MNYFTIVWGDFHIDMLMDYVLPSYLSDNNIKYVMGSNLFIYTDSNGIEKIEKHEYMSMLNKFMKVSFVLINKDYHINVIYKECFDNIICLSKNQVIKYIPPDCIISDGLLSTYERIKEGYKAVVMPFGALRVNASAIHDLAPMSSSEMVKFLIKNTHKETLSHYEDSNEHIVNPFQIIKKYTEDSFSINSFFHQFIFLLVDKDLWKGSNIEYDFVDNMLDDDEIYIMSNSDEGLEISVKQDDSQCYVEVGNKNFRKLVVDTIGKPSEFSRRCFNNGFFVHTKEGAVV